MNGPRVYPAKKESFAKFAIRSKQEFIDCVGGDELSGSALCVSRWINWKLKGVGSSNFFEPMVADVQQSTSPVYLENGIIYLTGSIGAWEDEVNIYAVREAVKRVSENTIKISIASPGGSLAEGYAIANYLMGLGRPIWTYVDGLTLSMGALLALVGERRYISRLASIMFHRVESIVIGNANDLRAELDVMDRLDAGIIDYIVGRTNMSRETVDQGMNGELWMSPDEAISAGVATEIVEYRPQAGETSNADNAAAMARANQNRAMLNQRRLRAVSALAG